MSRIDLRFAQAYFGLRQQVGPAGWPALKREAIGFSDAVAAQCGVPTTGPLPSDTTGIVACLSAAYEKQRDVWASRLTGPALEEANRPIEQHVQLQRDLQLRGLLPPDEKVDGVYGTTTRTAIMAWQQSTAAEPTGFLDDADAKRLGAGGFAASKVETNSDSRNLYSKDVVLLQAPITEPSKPAGDIPDEKKGQICKGSGTTVSHLLTGGSDVYTFMVVPEWTYHPYRDGGPEYTAICKLAVSISDPSGHLVFSDMFAWGGTGGDTYEADVFLHSMPDGTVVLVADQASGGMSISSDVRIITFGSRGARPALLLDGVEDMDSPKFHGSDLQVSGSFDATGHLCEMCKPIRTSYFQYDKARRQFVATRDNDHGVYLAHLAAYAFQASPWQSYPLLSLLQPTPLPDYKVDLSPDDLLARFHGSPSDDEVERASSLDVTERARLEAWANVNFTCGDWSKAITARTFNPTADEQSRFIFNWLAHFPPIAVSLRSSPETIASSKAAAYDLIHSVARHCDILGNAGFGDSSLADITWLAWTSP